MSKTLYALADPNTSEIRYIGITREPHTRLSGHTYDKISGPKREWVASLSAPPMMIPLAVVTDEDASMTEKKAIRHFTAKGYRLLNINGRAMPGPVMLGARVPADLHLWLRRHCVDTDTTIQEIVNQLLSGYRKKKEAK